MAPRDAEATRRRLLEAAAAEFAELGIAGARVDRIAAAARTNKAQIYHYFGSKDGLFEAVLASLLHEILESDPFDPGDLAETAGRIFDDFEDRPDLARLATWYRLERSAADPPHPAIVERRTPRRSPPSVRRSATAASPVRSPPTSCSAC